MAKIAMAAYQSMKKHMAWRHNGKASAAAISIKRSIISVAYGSKA